LEQVKPRLALLQTQVERSSVSVDEGHDQWKILVNTWLK
jgi:F-type H+-transporting ATPase subunit alpha